MGLFHEAERPALGRQILSFTPCSGLIWEQGDVGCVMRSDGQRSDSSQPYWGLCKEAVRPQCLRMMCVLIGLGGRGNCHNQGDKGLDFLCDCHLS